MGAAGAVGDPGVRALLRPRGGHSWGSLKPMSPHTSPILLCGLRCSTQRWSLAPGPD